MGAANRSGETLAGIRRLRGVSWEWRQEAAVDGEGREAGVIAQDVQAVFPELVTTGADGYLRVDYGGLAARLAEALLELADRVEQVEANEAARHELSDADAKRDLDPVESALTRLRAGEQLESGDRTALVGALVEAVKELDTRLRAVEAAAGSLGDASPD
jgi:hypothetical protein